jgi:hypothetical protein
MEPVLDKYRHILNVQIKKEYYNNYSIFKQKYIRELSPIEDANILKILKNNYLLYGIVTDEMIEKKDNNYINSEYNDSNNDSINDRFLFKSPDIIQYNDQIIEPNIMFQKVNKLIENTTKFLLLVDRYYSQIMEYDVQIMNYLTKLKAQSLQLYLENFIVFNNIRIFINTLFFEYYQDINFINNRLLQIKYDYFITETDIFHLNEKLNLFLQKYYESKTFVLCLEDKKLNFKVVNGEFDITNIVNIIDEKVDKLNNLLC